MGRKELQADARYVWNLGGHMKNKLRTVLLATTVATASAGGLAGWQNDEKAAVEAARQWLVLVDKGQYSTSWESAAGYFRGNVTRDEWGRLLTGARMPLGKVTSRKVKAKHWSTSLPGAPDGEYVVIQFETAFENKRSAIETVTPMKEKNGAWRVSGYFIK